MGLIDDKERDVLRSLLAFLGVLYVLAVVFAPPMPGRALLRYDDLILLLAVTVAVLTLVGKRWDRKLYFPFSGIIAVVYLFLFLILLSALTTNLRTGELGNMYKEVLRLFKYVLVAFIFAQITTPNSQAWIRRSIIAAGLVLVGLQLFQYFGGMDANWKFAAFYGGGSPFACATTALKCGRSFSAGGSFGNSNVAGSFLLIPLGLSEWKLFNLFKNRISHTQLWPFIMQFLIIPVVFMLWIGIVLTGSRATFIGAVGSLIIIGLLIWTDRDLNVKQLILLGIVVLVLLFLVRRLVVSFPLESIVRGMHRGGSFAVKMAILRDSIAQVYSDGALLGLGPGNGPQVDMEFGYALIWYGPIGVFLYLMLWAELIKPVWHFPTKFYDQKALLVVAISLLIVSLSQTNFFSIRIFPIFVALYFAEIKWDSWRYIANVSQQPATDLECVNNFEITLNRI